MATHGFGRTRHRVSSGKIAAVLGLSLATASALQAQCDPFFSQPTDAVALTARIADDGTNSALADNFVLTTPTQVCQVRARGAFLEDGAFPAATFTIIIHTDAAGVPGAVAYANASITATSQDPTGNTVFNAFSPPDGNMDEREFVFDLPVPVDLIPGTYWLELYQNVGTASWTWSQGNPTDPFLGLPGYASSVFNPGSAWSNDAENLSLELRGSAVASACSLLFGQSSLVNPPGTPSDVFPLFQIAADNFVTADPLDICGLDFRGAFADNTIPPGLHAGSAFAITLYGDAGGLPGAPLVSLPPMVPTAISVPTGLIVAGVADERIFRFDLAPAVSIPPGTYWISIQNVAPEPGDWLWSHAPAPAVTYGLPGAATVVPPLPVPGVERAFDVRAEVLGNPCANPIDVLVVGADNTAAFLANVAATLLGELPGGSTVDTFNAATDGVAGPPNPARTPTLADLQDYDAVLVYSSTAYEDRVTLGNNLADYYDGGGAVVTAWNDTAGGTVAVGGRWAADGYQAIERVGQLSGGSPTLGTLHHPLHPLLAGVSSLSAGTLGRRPAATDVTFGALQVADWSTGNVLLATKIGAPGSLARPIVDLGFWPISDDPGGSALGWDNGNAGGPDTDGEVILGNAIFHALGCTPFQPPTGSISDLVFGDDNANGIQDMGEAGIDGVDVTLLDETLAPLASTTTAGGGLYQFAGLLPAIYYLQFDDSTFPANTFITLQDQGMDDAADSDVAQDNSPVGPIAISFGDNDDSWDLGLATGATISDLAWEDEDGDGIQDLGEPGIDGVGVDLIDDSDDSVVASTSTAGGGLYEFNDVAPGTYRVRFTPEDSTWYFTQVNAGMDDAADSDVLEEYTSPAFGETEPFSVNVGDVDDTRDAGFFRLGAVSDFVWLDIDDDGIRDLGEPGVEGVTVELTNAALSVSESTSTDASGNYQFADLFPHDDYTVSFTLPGPGAPQISLFSPANEGMDDTVDSDADVVVDADTQSAEDVAVTSDDENDTVDCGMRDVTDPTATLECYPFGVFYSCTPNEDETFTVTFDEPVNLDDTAQVLVTNGSAGSFEPQCEDGAPCDVWTFVVTADAEGTVTVQVGVGAFDDPATNDNTATAVCEYVYDATAPIEDCGGALTNLTPSITNDEVIVFIVTFDEDVDGVDATDFSGNAAALITGIDPAAGPASSYIVEVTVPGPGTYTLAWNPEFGADWIEDCAGNDFEGSDAFGQVTVVDDSVALEGSLQYDEAGGYQGDVFGWSVAQSGPVTFIGTPGDEDSNTVDGSSGSVHVAQQDNAGSHPLVQRLRASDFDAGDRFGESVALDGDWGIVGAYTDEYTTGVLTTTQAGSAYFFRRDTTSGTWGDGLGDTDEFQKVQSSVNGPNWFFGRSVALQGRTAVVGVPQGQATSSLSTYRSGRAVVFEYDSCTDEWVETAQLTAGDAASLDGFGTSVAVFGSIALVGAPGDDDFGSATGAVYAFRRAGPGLWVSDGKLIPTGAAGGDNVGVSVALFGDYAIIGAPQDDDVATNAGAVYVMERVGPSNWIDVPMGKLLASDGALSDLFGSAVAFDGQTVAVGAPGHNALLPLPSRTDSGALYTFESTGWTETNKFVDALTTANDKLGTSVAVDGFRVVGGAPYGEERIPGPPTMNVGNVSFFQLP